jgi:hypothetical protein
MQLVEVRASKCARLETKKTEEDHSVSEQRLDTRRAMGMKETLLIQRI